MKIFDKAVKELSSLWGTQSIFMIKQVKNGQ